MGSYQNYLVSAQTPPKPPEESAGHNDARVVAPYGNTDPGGDQRFLVRKPEKNGRFVSLLVKRVTVGLFGGVAVFHSGWLF